MSSEGSWQGYDPDRDAAFRSDDYRPNTAPEDNSYDYYGQSGPQPGFEQPTPPADPLAANAAYQPGVQDSWTQPYEGSPRSQMTPYLNPNYPRPDHPNATSSIVLGVIGFFVPFLSPVALALAARGRKDVREHPGVYAGEGNLTAGYVIGIIGTVLLAFYVLIMLVMIGAVLASW